jgi:hypothetical protein
MWLRRPFGLGDAKKPLWLQGCRLYPEPGSCIGGTPTVSAGTLRGAIPVGAVSYAGPRNSRFDLTFLCAPTFVGQGYVPWKPRSNSTPS